MQLLFDFFPVVAFFVTYKLTDIYVATGVLIVAVLAQSAIQWVRHRKVSTMALISGALVLIFGGLTLLIRDEMFIKWKVTVVNWLFASGFLLSHFFGDQPFVQRMLAHNIELSRPLWLKLSWMWIAFFTTLGAVNLYITYHFSTDVWAAFKLYGMIGLTLLFVFLQAYWLSSKMPADSPSSSDPQ